MHLGDKLKLYRKAKDLDQLQMAELIGISERTYRGVEKTGIVTKAKDLASIRKILAESTDKQQDNLDTILPMGDLKITLRDYFEEIRQQKAFLQELILNKILDIDANLNVVSERQQVADAKRGRALELMFGLHLGVQPGRTVEELIEIVDTGSVNSFVKQKKKDIRNSAGK